jgi:hypothetical protein
LVAMPRAFRPHPAHPAFDYLVRLHAELGARMLANQVEAKRAWEEVTKLEAKLLRLKEFILKRAEIDAELETSVGVETNEKKDRKPLTARKCAQP